jgi:hypothetical protein
MNPLPIVPRIMLSFVVRPDGWVMRSERIQGCEWGA